MKRLRQLRNSVYIIFIFQISYLSKFQKTPKFYSTFKPEAIDSFESLLKIIEELKDK